MKTILIVLALIISVQLNAQDMRNYHRYKSIYSPQWQIALPINPQHKKAYIKGLNVKEVMTISYSTNKKGKKKKVADSLVYRMNAEGEIASIERYRKNQLFYSSEYGYTESVVTTTKSTNRKGEIERQEYRTLNSKTAPYRYYVVNKKGDTTSDIRRSVISGHKSTDLYFSKGKLKYRWENTYYENGERKQTKLYKGNGKVAYIYDYSCKPEGVEIKKHKDTSTICVAKELDQDGYTTKVTRSVNEKGELMTTISKYNKYMRLVLQNQLKGPDEELLRSWKMTYADNDTTILEQQYSVFNNNDLRYSEVTTFDMEGKEKSRVNKSYKKGKLKSHVVTQFDSDKEGRPKTKITKSELKQTARVTQFYFKS